MNIHCFMVLKLKFYSARPKVREGFESEIDGLYVGGDGAGLTRGLAQAGAKWNIDCQRYYEKNKIDKKKHICFCSSS